MNRKSNVLCNPYFVYIYSFLTVFFVYWLNWSDLYADLSASTYIFFASTFLVALILGYYLQNRSAVSFVFIPDDYGNIKNCFIACIVLVILEIAYSRQIPFLAALKGAEYGKTEFGIPTLHTFIVSFISFLATYVFYMFLLKKRKVYLLYYSALLIFPLILISRSALLIIILSSLFVYLLYKGRSVYKVLVGLVVGVLLLLLLFGYLGNLRSGFEASNYADPSDFILDVGQARESFRESDVPKPYFWAYLYISSPLANLQETINDAHPTYYSTSVGLPLLVQQQFLWDFINKRLDKLDNLPESHFKQVAPVLTTGTIYAESFLYLQWTGMVLTFIYICVIIFLYAIFLRPDNKYYVVGFSILNTIILLNLFDNMFVYSPLSIQLIFPFLLRIRLRFPKKNE